MVKTKIVETTEKYDRDGKLVEKITREETTEDDTDYVPFYSYSGDKSNSCGEGAFCGSHSRSCGCPGDNCSDDFCDLPFSTLPDGSVNITADSVTINQQPA